MVSRLLTPAPKQPTENQTWVNRRVSIRHGCGKETTGKIVAGAELRVRKAKIHDISLGGVALVVASPLKPGTRLLIQINNSKLDFSYDLAASVVHSSRKARGKWLIGCAFARDLSEAELDNLL